MKPNQIEARVLRILDQVADAVSLEDQYVELKREIPTDLHKFARQIAALCNSSRGQDVLVLLGVDENNGAVGCEPPDFQEWWAQVARHFCDCTPEMYHCVVQSGNSVVVAIHLKSDRAPYLVRTLDGGRVESEIPWREGTRTRTARRHEILRILDDSVMRPVLQVQQARFVADQSRNQVDGKKAIDGSQNQILSLSIEVDLYVIPSRRSDFIVFPLHLASVDISGAEQPEILWQSKGPFQLSYLGPRRRTFSSGEEPIFPVDTRQSRTIDSTTSEAIVSGPGLMIAKIHFGVVKHHPPDKSVSVSGVIHLESAPDCFEYRLPFESRLY